MMLLLLSLTGLSGLSVLCFGRWLGEKGSKWITGGGVLGSFFLNLMIYFPALYEKKVFLLEGPIWFQAGWLEVRWSFCLDSLSILMLVVVLGISSFVHFYSFDYMKGDPHLPRFLSYLSLFTFFMVLLVTSFNFLQLFLGWEGVGLCSFLLINFWFTRKQANKSALKAMVVNRVGDIGLMLAFCLIYLKGKSLDFSVLFLLVPTWSQELFWYGFSYLEVVAFFLLLGAIGKSAQLGLHIWLPDAMEGPTPVSALIHAATMVTAGVFLVVRCSVFFEYAPRVLGLLALLGGLTALFAASTGLFQNDLKKVIAYSTCSQLGYMFLACGLSSYEGAMFHLFTHAFFKALLFLGAGGVIHSFLDEQDLRKMGGFVHLLPFTYISMVIGSVSLMGFPFFSGFYSKEWILEVLAGKSADPFYFFLYVLGVLSAILTSIYSVRLIYLAFLSVPRRGMVYYRGVHEVPFWMGWSYFVLMICSVLVGYLFRESFIGLGTDFWNYSIFVHYDRYGGLDAEFLPFFLKLVPLAGAFFGTVMSYLFHKEKSMEWMVWLKKDGKDFLNFLSQKWYIDHLSNKAVNFFLQEGYRSTFKSLDRGAFEWYGPMGLVYSVSFFSKKVSELQSGYLSDYLGWMILGMVFLVTIISLEGFESFFFLTTISWILYVGREEKNEKK